MTTISNNKPTVSQRKSGTEKEVPTKAESKKLINILEEREPLPVILPPVGENRKNKVISQKFAVKTASKSFNLRTKDQVPFIEGDDAPNPFEYPTNVEEFMAQYELERAEQRKLDANVPPLMKGTNLYKQNQQVLARIKPFLQPSFKPSLANEYKKVIWKAQHGLHINHLQKVSRKMHTEYIMQRKQIYYLRRAIRARQIALDMVNRNREFEEERLKEFEWLTDFTNETFEIFLKENDDATHSAARLAETALKEKLEKTLEIREYNIQINQLKTDIISTNEGLRECKIYMRFLDDIAREIMRKDEEEEIRAYHREQQIKEELIDYLKEGMSLRKAQKLVAKRAKEFQDDQWQLGKNSRSSFGSGSVDFIQNLNKQIRKHLGMPDESSSEFAASSENESTKKGHQKGNLTPRSLVGALVNHNQSRLHSAVKEYENLEDLLLPDNKEVPTSLYEDYSSINVNDPANEDIDGYNEKALLKSLDLVPGNEKTDKRELANMSFTRPSQLLQIYSDMEEANLSLIQHSQASEELLERVNHQIYNTRKGLNHRAYMLRSEINRMHLNIDLNEERAQALAMLVEMFTGGNYDVRQQQKLYRVLQKHVTKVYKTAIGSVDQHLNPIMMLTSVEKNFEDLMREIQAMPTDVVVQISRELDKERREMERVEKMNQRKAVTEERKSRALARAKAPVHKKKGRPLLARSHPPKMVIALSQAELDAKAEADEFQYFYGP